MKLPEYQEQKEIKYNIKTFTFEPQPKQYKYKPYKPPKRKNTSRIIYQGSPYMCKNISINLINHQREKIHQELYIKQVLICVLVLAHVLIRIDYIALVENITKLYK